MGSTVGPEYTVVWSGRESLSKLTVEVAPEIQPEQRRILAECRNCGWVLEDRRYQGGRRAMFCGRCLKRRINLRKKAKYASDQVYRELYRKKERDRYWNEKRVEPTKEFQCAGCYRNFQRSHVRGPIERRCASCRKTIHNNRRRTARSLKTGKSPRGPYRSKVRTISHLA